MRGDRKPTRARCKRKVERQRYLATAAFGFDAGPSSADPIEVDLQFPAIIASGSDAPCGELGATESKQDAYAMTATTTTMQPMASQSNQDGKAAFPRLVRCRLTSTMAAATATAKGTPIRSLSTIAQAHHAKTGVATSLQLMQLFD